MPHYRATAMAVMITSSDHVETGPSNGEISPGSPVFPSPSRGGSEWGSAVQVWTTTLTARFCQLADAYQLVSRRLRRANLPMLDQRNVPPTPLTVVESFGKDAGE